MHAIKEVTEDVLRIHRKSLETLKFPALFSFTPTIDMCSWLVYN